MCSLTSHVCSFASFFVSYPLYYPYYDARYCPGGDPLQCSNRNAAFRFELVLSSS